MHSWAPSTLTGTMVSARGGKQTFCTSTAFHTWPVTIADLLFLTGAIELLAELCPASPASSRFLNGLQCAVHSVTTGSHVSGGPSPYISNR